MRFRVITAESGPFEYTVLPADNWPPVITCESGNIIPWHAVRKLVPAADQLTDC